MKQPSDAEKKAAEAAAQERIARAKQRIKDGNATREEVLADCEREKKTREIANDVVGALTWSLTAMGLGGQGPKTGKRKPAGSKR